MRQSLHIVMLQFVYPVIYISHLEKEKKVLKNCHEQCFFSELLAKSLKPSGHVCLKAESLDRTSFHNVACCRAFKEFFFSRG